MLTRETKNNIFDNMLLISFYIDEIEVKRLPYIHEMEIFRLLPFIQDDNEEVIEKVFKTITSNGLNSSLNVKSQIITIWYHKSTEFFNNKDLEMLFPKSKAQKKEKDKKDKSILNELDYFHLHMETCKNFDDSLINKYNFNYLSLLNRMSETKTASEHIQLSNLIDLNNIKSQFTKKTKSKDKNMISKAIQKIYNVASGNFKANLGTWETTSIHDLISQIEKEKEETNGNSK